MERLLRTVFPFAITGEHGTFFSDEAHFELNSCVNKQNMCCWIADNPNWSITKLLHSELVTVWCAISYYRIVRPFFLRRKIDTLLVLIPHGMKICRILFFSELKTLSCPKKMLVSRGWGDSTHNNLVIVSSCSMLHSGGHLRALT